MNEDYLAYLRSQDWKEKRREFMEEAEGLCEECGDKATEIHHLNYDSLGDEEREDVKIVCRGCHEDLELEKGTDLSYGDGYGGY